MEVRGALKFYPERSDKVERSLSFGGLLNVTYRERSSSSLLAHIGHELT